MKNKLIYISAFLLTFTLAVVAFAQVPAQTLGDIFGYKAVVVTKAPGVGDPRAGALHIGRLNREFPSTTHRITRLLRGDFTIDFASSTITCVDSSAQTLTGARTGDICIVSPPSGSTANTSFSCRVSASDAVVVRYCPAGTAADPASGSYNVMVLSNAAP